MELNIEYMKEGQSITNSLVDLFTIQVEKHPEKIALKCGDVTYTYKQLDQTTTQFANYLMKQGVKPQTLVGIYVERSEKMILAMLGIIKVGAVYVPLDPTHPVTRNNFIFEEARLQYIITQHKYLTDIEEDRTCMCLEEILDEIKSQDCTLPKHIPSKDQLTYVIFTSGSTGKPKGVEVKQESVVNYLVSVGNNLKLSGDEKVLAVVTISFDISMSEIYLPLTYGGTLIIADDQTVKDAPRLLQVIECEQINFMGFTPSMAYMLLDAGWNDAKGMKLLIGGEPWSIQLAHQLLGIHCDQVWNVYGPTETTIYSAMVELTMNDTYIPIGNPLNQTTLYVLDDAMNQVKVGQEGELYIGGVGVARGYLNNMTLTNERFIKNPFDNVDTRLYKTGDIVKRVDEETLVYVERKDLQVKVRGYRIELGEIEAALEKQEDVIQAVAVVQGKEKDAKICAFIKLKNDSQITVHTIREGIWTLLPSYMLPNSIMVVDEYPRTANFKVDRKALAAMDSSNKEISLYVAPRNEIEEEIVKIWEEILDVKPIGIYDNFLDMGGHSLMANRLIIRLNEMFGTTLSVIDIISTNLTVEEMAKKVEINLLSGLSEEELADLMSEV